MEREQTKDKRGTAAVLVVLRQEERSNIIVLTAVVTGRLVEQYYYVSLRKRNQSLFHRPGFSHGVPTHENPESRW